MLNDGKTGLCRTRTLRHLPIHDHEAPARRRGPAVPQTAGGEIGHGPTRRSRERVSEMLLEIERDGEDALRRYSRELDGWEPATSSSRARRSTRAEASTPELREHLERRASASRRSPAPSAATLSDLERRGRPRRRRGPSARAGRRVGAYLPPGRVPLLASRVHDRAGAEGRGRGDASSRARRRGAAAPVIPACVHAAAICGADRVFALGGVQALAAMAFGLGGDRAGRHDRRRGQRVRGRGQAPALRARRHRPARRAVGDRGHRRRRRRPRARRRRPARPGRARPDLARRADHDLRGPRPRACAPRSPASSRSSATAEVAGAAWRDHGAIIVAARPRDGGARSATSSPPSTSRCRRRRRRLVPRAAAQLRLDLPRPARDGRVLGQGRDGHQPRAADRRTPRATPAGSRSRAS